MWFWAVLFSTRPSSDLLAIVYLTVSLHALVKKPLFLPLKACHTSAQHVPQLIFPSRLSSVLLLKFCQVSLNAYISQMADDQIVFRMYLILHQWHTKMSETGLGGQMLQETTCCSPCDGSKRVKRKTRQCYFSMTVSARYVAGILVKPWPNTEEWTRTP